MSFEDRHWATLNIDQLITETGWIITVATNHQCHLWMYWCPLSPYIKKNAEMRRGSAMCWLKNYALKYGNLVEQTNPGFTFTHTFVVSPWPVCETRWFFFHGRYSLDGGELWSPSNSPIFHKHRTAAPVTAYFYPDKHPEVTSVDGWAAAQFTPLPATWSMVHNAVGDYHGDTALQNIVRIQSSSIANAWTALYRSIMLFDTSSIPLGSEIIAAELRISLYSIAQVPQWSQFSLVVVGSDPDSNTDIVNTDYSKLFSTPLSIYLMLSDLVGQPYAHFDFNTAGRMWITPGGITKLGLREYHYDVLDEEPYWIASKAASLLFRSAEQTTLSLKPRLEVIYQPP